MLLVDAEAVHRLLDYPSLVEALRQAHRGPVPKSEHLVQDEPENGDNKFVALVGWQKDVLIAVKLVGVFPCNHALVPPQPSVQGIVAVFDATTGKPRLICDGAAITFRKTAADSALGASFLARHDAEVLLVVGAGGMARHVIDSHFSVRPSLKRVLIWNRTHDRASALAASYSNAAFTVEPVHDIDSAVASADIVSCVTMATAPLVRGNLLKPGAHLDLIGAYLPDMRETDDDAIARGSVFVDTRNGMQNAGDLLQPVIRGVIGWDAVCADLFDLCLGRHPGRTTPEEITVFKNVGGGHLDLFTVQHLASRL